VDGENFVTGAVIQWNGVDRPTTVRSGKRLTADVSASDVATPTVASITVRNPGVATVSNAVDFTVRTLAPAATTSQLVVDVPANDVVYDPVSALLYASVPSTGGIYGNSIVAIDPVTGTVTKSIFIGSEPEFLAVSDNGQYLYVSLRGASSVRRVALTGFMPGLEFALGNGFLVEEMAVVPGAPGTVVLSKMNTGSSPKHLGVFVYDDGTQRGTATPGHTGSNSITFAGRTAARLYGYNNETTDFGFRTMVLDANGVRITNTTGGLIGAFYTHITGAGGRVYATNGAIIDPELLVRTGSFAPNYSGAPVGICADAALGRVYFLANGTIEAFDMNTMQSLGSITAPGPVTEHPALARQHLVRWGTDGLAYRASGKVYILRATLSAP
jgi:DNA-binding beta-propeller fold protein YncE